MKTKSLFLFFLFLVAGITVQAQHAITLLTFESYTFQDEFDTEYGTGKVQDGFQWGGGLEVELRENLAVEIIYQNLKTDAYYYGIDTRYEGKIGVNYILAGVTKYAPLNERISGFGTFDMGVGIFKPSETLNSDDVVKFSLGGRLGLRIKATEKVSFRIHGQLLSPVQWAGAGFYFGTGGSGTGVSTGSTIWQWNLGGSLNFRLK